MEGKYEKKINKWVLCNDIHRQLVLCISCILAWLERCVYQLETSPFYSTSLLSSSATRVIIKLLALMVAKNTKNNITGLKVLFSVQDNKIIKINFWNWCEGIHRC